MSGSHLLQYAKKPSGKAPNENLFNHVTKLVQATADSHNPVKGVDKLELLSNHLKQTEFYFKEPEHDKELNSRMRPDGENKPYLDAAARISELAETANTTQVILPNLQQQHKALKTASISFGENNYILLQKVLKVLAIENKAKQLRFWGKILGLRDYWVIQGTTNRKNTDEFPKNAEAAGTGINTYSYWVAHDLLGKWVQLPVITPEQLKASREVKYIFTGELDRSVDHYPPYPGKEKHLLKAQIVRITHSCELAPKGLYKISEENGISTVDFEDEFKLGEVADLNNLDSWVHLNQYVLHQGRCSYYIDPALTEEQRTALDAQNGEKDPLVDRFKSIAEDKPLEKLGYTTNWAIQLAGQSQTISAFEKQAQTVYGVACLKNLTWPGATTVGYSGGWVNIYIGYGQKIIQASFNPVQPKDIAVEGEDKQEYRQPNPSKPIPPPAEVEPPKVDEPPPAQ